MKKHSMVGWNWKMKSDLMGDFRRREVETLKKIESLENQKKKLRHELIMDKIIKDQNLLLLLLKK